MIRHQPQQMINAVQARAALVGAFGQIPWRFGNIGALKHLFLGLGILLPAHTRLQIHRATLPVLYRVMDAHEKAHLLFLIGDREPILNQGGPRAHRHPLEFRHIIEELRELIIGRKAHDPLDSGAIVAGAVNEHDLATSVKMRDLAQELPL